MQPTWAQSEDILREKQHVINVHPGLPKCMLQSGCGQWYTLRVCRSLLEAEE